MTLQVIGGFSPPVHPTGQTVHFANDLLQFGDFEGCLDAPEILPKGCVFQSTPWKTCGNLYCITKQSVARPGSFV